MPFQNLNIDRIIIHEIFKRAEDRNPCKPRFGNQLINLDVEAKVALQLRITEALGQSLHGLEMAIRDSSETSMFDFARKIIETTDEGEFIRYSQKIATKLAEAQTTRVIPGGIVVVISGRTGHPGRAFMCVIKAEPHPGFRKQEGNDGRLQLEYLKDLILTPQAKLYKIGAFLHPESDLENEDQALSVAGWRVFLFDDLVSRGNRLRAAQYFYESFLGFTFPVNSAFQTKQFHSLTKDFIRNADIDEEAKSDLLNALTTYLKTDQAQTIQVAEFAKTYLAAPELIDSYTTYMEQKEFPQQAIRKDLSEVASALKQRKITFGKNIRLTAPAEEFESLVRIQSIEGEPDPAGQIPKWTQITIRDHIRDQE